MADIRGLASTLRRYPNPASSSDPRIRMIVANLRTLPMEVEPRPEFRAELRAQLVAVAPRLIAEGVTPASPRGSGERRRGHLITFAQLRRPLLVVGSLLVVFAMLLGGAIWMSGRTLPGDSLYGLKRASENVQLSLTSGDGARGRAYLALAKKRVSEASALASRPSALAGGIGPQAAGGINQRTADLIVSTLNDFNSDTHNGARLLGGQAVRDRQRDPLDFMTKWGAKQASRLSDIARHLQPGPARLSAVSAEGLAHALSVRASQLRHDIGCTCLSGSGGDTLGPKPCKSPCNPVVPVAPTQGGSTGSSGGSAPTPPNSSGGGSLPSGQASAGPNATSAVPIPGLPTSGSSGTESDGGQIGGHNGDEEGHGGSGSSTGLPLPSLRSTPLSLDSCGAHLSLGLIGLGIGKCGIDLQL